MKESIKRMVNHLQRDACRLWALAFLASPASSR